MKNMVYIAILLFLTLFIPNIYANDECCTLDEVVVVASKEPMWQSTLGRDVGILDEYLLGQYKPKRLVEAITAEPGVSVKQIVGLSSVRIRGARSFDTKYLLDGVPLEDPTDVKGSFSPFVDDLVLFGTSEIEILKGSGSTLYGSEAIGGAVNVEPLLNMPFSYTQEIGDEVKELLETPYGSAFRLDGERLDKTGFYFAHQFEYAKPWVMYQEGTSPINDSPFITGGELHFDEQDENNRSEESVLNAGAKFELGEWGNWVTSWGNTKRRFVFLPDADGTDFYSDGTYTGRTLYSDLSFNVYGFVLGHSYRRSFYELEISPDSDEIDHYQNDLYIEKSLTFDKLNLLLGVRENLHENTKHRTVYDVSGTYVLTHDTKIRGHFGTGYRVPSLFELNGAFLSSFGRFEVGNPDLSPERSYSVDAGVERRLWKNTGIGVTLFGSKISNQIDFVGSTYENVEGDFRTDGYEAFIEHFFLGSAVLRLSYTRTNGKSLIDIPKHEGGIALRIQRKKWNASLRGTFKDEHVITAFNIDTFTADKIKEEGHVVFDATAGYFVRPNVEVFARIENLFSEDYLEGGYRQPGTKVYGGVKITV